MKLASIKLKMFYTFSKTILQTSVTKCLEISLKICLVDFESYDVIQESVFHYIVMKASLYVAAHY